MKKSEKIFTSRLINYGSESIDVTKQCCIYLMEHDFHNNTQLENINLLERSLLNYSIIKLVDWHQDVESIDMDKLEDLESLCKLIKELIPNKEHRDSYFNQYVHCIIYVLGEINKQDQINWQKVNNQVEEINISTKNNLILGIITNNNLPSYQVPSKLLNEIKNKYLEEKKVLFK